MQKSAKSSKKSLRMVPLAGFIIVCLLLSNFLSTVNISAAPYTGMFEFVTDFDFLRAGSYHAYLARHAGNPVITGHRIEIDGNSFSSAYPAPVVEYDFMDNPGPTVITGETGYIEFTFHVQYGGMYNIYIEYFNVPGRGNDIERRLLINGEIPFNHAAFLEFPRFWANDGPIRQDSRGNDLRPSQIEIHQWSRAYFRDFLGYENRPYLFYFKQGENILRLEGSREPIAIRRIALHAMPEPYIYSEVAARNAGKPLFSGEPIVLQGQDFAFTTSRMIYPLNDRTSPYTQPSHPYLVRLNTIGRERWRFPGQTIYWTFTVPESALYQINIKYRQNINSGSFVTRSIRINGETPFVELENVRYSFNSRWQIEPLSNENNEPFLFWLEAGEHTLSMEVVLGDWAEILSAANESMHQLNYAYRQMLLLLGPNPDPFRDYQLERFMPGALAILGQQHYILTALMHDVIAINDGRRGEGTSMLQNLALHVGRMYADPEAIPDIWRVFRDNLSAMGTWILNMREQPLEIDFIMITAPGADLPRAEAGFFRRLWHEIRALIASFTNDFSAVGDVYEDAIEVWIMSGRDQAQILKSLADNTFTPYSGIPVNVRLVSGAMVLPAAVTGRGPDVLLGQGQTVPVDWGLRGAAQDLSHFPGFDEVLEYFHFSAHEPFWHEGQLFGLPETQNFMMMFARVDILEELGLPIPQTWEQFEIVMSELQKNHMDVHIPYSFPDNIGFFLSLLFQRGGEVYDYGGMRSALDSEASVQAFRQWSMFFTHHGVPVFDWDPGTRFVNRFRNGEMPLGFWEHTTFNTLAVFAPELRGLWQFFPLPGTVDEYGNLNRSAAAGSTATMMLSQSENQMQAWEFMRWWVSAETQTLYGRELESLIGVAARYNTANRQAVENLAWTYADFSMLSAQWEWARGFPQVPGGYFTPRHVSNALRTVVNDDTDPRETLWDFVEVIDNEIRNKRREFGLPYFEIAPRR